MSTPEEDDYLCVGVCIDDVDSGYCIGCGRPPSPASLESREYDAIRAAFTASVEPITDVTNDKAD